MAVRDRSIEIGGPSTGLTDWPTNEAKRAGERWIAPWLTNQPIDHPLTHTHAGFKVKTGRKTWAFEVRQLDKHADLWVREIQEAIDRCVA